MLIIMRLNCIDASSVIVTLRKWLSGAPDSHLLRVTIPGAASIQPPDDDHTMLETCRRS